MRKLNQSKAESGYKKIIAYSRVTSQDPKEDLGSGMNCGGKGLKKLIRLILSGKVSDIDLTHKDRLIRFGSELILLVRKLPGVRVYMIHEDQNLSHEQLPAFDFPEIITVLSARIYAKI